MGKYFGTDGVRGVANSELTPELAFKIGRFGGCVLTRIKNFQRYSLDETHVYPVIC